MTSHYLYKNQYDKALIYADCEWINNVDLSQDDPTLTICRLTLTDTKAFWTGSVTRGDLRSFENSGVSPILLSRVIQAALQGAKEAQGQKMDWKTMPKKSTCEVALIAFHEDSLPIRVGSIELKRVDDSKREDMWRLWLEASVSQSTELRERQTILVERNKDLENHKEAMEQQIEDMTREKIAADMQMMQKLKQLINTKKRKIMKLQSLIDQQKSHKVLPSTQSSQGPSRRKRGASSQSDATERKRPKKKHSNVNAPPDASQLLKDGESGHTPDTVSADVSVSSPSSSAPVSPESKSTSRQSPVVVVSTSTNADTSQLSASVPSTPHREDPVSETEDEESESDDFSDMKVKLRTPIRMRSQRKRAAAAIVSSSKKSESEKEDSDA